ncbi:lipase member H-A-like [Adelges cooleyi]|uniref:lipase member H-A-like n=1 Tax=Adelges cooleyi TaxID=133065 RepID=UPI00218014A9|nr:lipase member H-A-like [Adelges cooleyi]
MLDYHKKMSIYFVLLLCLISRSTGVDVEDLEIEEAEYSNSCSGELGCMNVTVKPVSLFDHIQGFHLYTRTNPKKSEKLESKKSVKNSKYFDPKKPTKFIVHGYLAKGLISWPEWMQEMKNELLTNSDWNVILVGWYCRTTYGISAMRTRTVGKTIGKFINYLKDRGQDLNDVHLIGHSLGAHIVGFAGKRLNGRLGRITGLDPAGPLFELNFPKYRLHHTDAQFVDSIHTGLPAFLKPGFGMARTCGHVDFYPNGGNNQPGCKSLGLSTMGSGMEWLLACNHHRAIYYFIESINSKDCSFDAHQCDSYKNFQKGKCFNNQTEISTMGLNAQKPSHSPGSKSFLMTGKSKPFCRPQYKVTLHRVNILGHIPNNNDLINTMEDETSPSLVVVQPIDTEEDDAMESDWEGDISGVDDIYYGGSDITETI